MPRSSARPASRSEAGERGSTPCSRSEKPECPDRKVLGAGFTLPQQFFHRLIIQIEQRKFIYNKFTMNPIVILFRLVLPLSILKFPLIGGGLAIILDNLDWHTKQLFGIQPIFEYQLIDKFLDTYYLALLAIVAWRFRNKLIRNVTVGLFVYRFIGFVLFEITGIRMFLFIFPNIFENFFFFYYIIKTTASYEPKIRYLGVLIFIMMVAFPKMLQEYSIHVIQEPLELNLFGYNYIYQGATHQILYIVTIAVLLGIFYRKNKERLSQQK